MSSEAEFRSREMAERARETEWKKASFLRDLFLGSLRLDLVQRAVDDRPWRAEFQTFYRALEALLVSQVDPVAIDESGEYPREVIAALTELGAFGMKIPREYGGLGFSQREYETAMQLVGSHDANVTALLSAHQSIGVPQPVMLFGTEEQKRRYLPRCARGAISGFALTEPSVGSDPARVECVADATADGEAFVLNGVKLWCTNGTLAELLVVIARTPPDDGLSAFVVETGWKGVEVLHRCRFMGLKALANAELAFHDVRVPRENLIGPRRLGPQDRARHPQHRPADAARGDDRRREGVPRDLPQVGQRARPVGKTDRQSTRPSPTSSPTWQRRPSRWSPSPSSWPRWPTGPTTTSGSRPPPRRSGTPSGRGASSTTPSRSAVDVATRPSDPWPPAAKFRSASSG